MEYDKIYVVDGVEVRYDRINMCSYVVVNGSLAAVVYTRSGKTMARLLQALAMLGAVNADLIAAANPSTSKNYVDYVCEKGRAWIEVRKKSKLLERGRLSVAYIELGYELFKLLLEHGAVTVSSSDLRSYVVMSRCPRRREYGKIVVAGEKHGYPFADYLVVFIKRPHPLDYNKLWRASIGERRRALTNKELVEIIKMLGEDAPPFALASVLTLIVNPG